MAKKGKFYPIRFVLAGMGWSVVYFGIIIPLLGQLFQFDFLSLDAWKNKYQDFLEFQWKINNPFDGALLMCMLFFIPIFLITWIVWYRLLAKVRLATVHTKPKPQKLADLQKARQPFVPQKLPAAQITKEYKAPVLPGQQQKQGEQTVKSHTNLAQIIKDSAAVARNYKVEIFQHILLEGFRVPLAVSTDARAVLIEVVNKRGVNWSVEFTEKVEDSNWYSDGGNMQGALRDLIGASRSLAKSEPNSEVLSAVLIPSGRILNAQQSIDYLKSKGVYLLGFKDGQPKDLLQTLEAFLTEMFELKSGENAGKVKPIAPKKSPVTPAAAPAASVEAPATSANPAVPVSDNAQGAAANPAGVVETGRVEMAPAVVAVNETERMMVDDGSLLNENELEDIFLIDVVDAGETPNAG